MLRKISRWLVSLVLLFGSFNTLHVKADTLVSVGIGYEVSVVNSGWQPMVFGGDLAGDPSAATGLEAFRIFLSDAVEGGHITYRAYVDNAWLDWSLEGSDVGTTGSGKTLKALQIKLVDYPNAQVHYQVYLQGKGWTKWVKDGRTAGNTQSGVIQGLRIKIFEVGVQYNSYLSSGTWQGLRSNGETSGNDLSSVQIESIQIDSNLPAGAHIEYRVHVEDTGWSTWIRNGAPAGTSGSGKPIEALEARLVSLPSYALTYQAYVQNQGWGAWVNEDETAGTTGLGLNLQAFRVKVVKVKNEPSVQKDENPSKYAEYCPSGEVQTYSFQSFFLNNVTTQTVGVLPEGATNVYLKLTHSDIHVDLKFYDGALGENPILHFGDMDVVLPYSQGPISAYYAPDQLYLYHSGVQNPDDIHTESLKIVGTLKNDMTVALINHMLWNQWVTVSYSTCNTDPSPFDSEPDWSLQDPE